MKNIILFILLMASAKLLSAQTLTFYTENLDAYVGVWEYHTATDTFRILLKKGKIYNPDGNVRKEQVYGGHRYVKNRQVIADYTRGIASSRNRNYEVTPISASNGAFTESEVNPNELGLSFNDKLKDKIGYGTLTLIPGNPAQLHWKIEFRNDQMFLILEGDPEPVVYDDWSVPKDIILTKISDTVPGLGTRFSGILDDDLMDVGETNP